MTKKKAKNTSASSTRAKRHLVKSNGILAKLTDEQRRRLEALAKLPDDEIDTFHAPEFPEEGTLEVRASERHKILTDPEWRRELMKVPSWRKRLARSA
jgi:hypothetical protein